jgi:ATPase subunit of ABC transporter with duplicated ATPase domains
MSFALELHGVAKQYRAGEGACLATVVALRDIRLSVARGEVVVISGAPGSGKSTLLLCAAGLLIPDRGLICWFAQTDRATAACRARFHFGGADLADRLERCAPTREPLLHLIDSRASRGALSHEADGRLSARVAHWVEQRRAAGDAVVIAAHHDADIPLTARVVRLRDGCLDSPSCAFPIDHSRIRVAEPASPLPPLPSPV